MRRKRATSGVQHFVARFAGEAGRERCYRQELVERCSRLRIERARLLVAEAPIPDVRIRQLPLLLNRGAAAIDIEWSTARRLRVAFIAIVDARGRVNRPVAQRRLTDVPTKVEQLAIVA